MTSYNIYETTGALVAAGIDYLWNDLTTPLAPSKCRPTGRPAPAFKSSARKLFQLPVPERGAMLGWVVLVCEPAAR